MNIPLNTKPSDEIVFAACRMGLCMFEASQKQPVFKQVAGCQLSHVFGFKDKKMAIVSAEIRMAARRGNAKPEIFFISCSSISPSQN
jgi:hypothetical protein